jgi:cell shape-determining protein MreD
MGMIGLSQSSSFLIFLAAFSGAIAVEFAALLSLSRTGRGPALPRGWLYWLVRFLVAAVAGALALSLQPTSTTIAFVIGASVPQLLKVMVSSTLPGRIESEAVERRIQAKEAIVKSPEKTRPYWDEMSANLLLFYNRNLSQTRLIFWFTVLVLAAGFALICYGVLNAFRQARIEAAILATGAGVLTEFIAATLLVLYKSALGQASEFVQSLEKINAVGMSLQIVDDIPELASELRNKTRAELAIKLLSVFEGRDVKKAGGSRRDKKASRHEEGEE